MVARWLGRAVVVLVAGLIGLILLAPGVAVADEETAEPSAEPTSSETPEDEQTADPGQEATEESDEVVVEGSGFLVTLIDESDKSGGEAGTPIPEVTLSVFECPELATDGTCPERGDELGTEVTNSEGQVFFSLERGRYVLALDEGTLPDGIELDDNTSAELGQTLRLSAPTNMVFPIGTSAVESASFGEELSTNVVSGLKFGLIIALAALGLNLIFGTTGLTNFAHGELLTFGAAVTLGFNLIGIPVIAAAALGLICSCLFGYLQDRGIWRPLRHRGSGLIAMMIVSIGFGILLRYLFQYFMGGSRRPYSEYTAQQRKDYGIVELADKEIAIILISIALLALVGAMLMGTRLGKAMRAVSDNPSLAASSGMRVDGVISAAWVLGAGLTGMSGVLMGIQNQVVFDMGFKLLLIIFAAATLGGLGTIWGAMVGAIIVGLVVEVAPLFGMPTSIKQASALAILILILLIRPQGILGRRERVG
ncbi:branched-chain amino acid ABC transporter permease [Nocardioides panacisoli]|uniref:branched-chain amino acid ABC transporter permease n=1 Tax=Nocardioides panacisoli TaxID=627624 RepID=UPI001C63B1BD|nr:branched-chain amino acid ABC transporter permease [Nocardioides panacisoli]QYJ04776.1 branched-chain amino acid ABC transporter permease [Nocardioides panacisoli]